jgi:hypothetical protein
VSRDLHELIARRDLTGRENDLDKWKREMLELEQARAREVEEDRHLTDSEASHQRDTLQRIISESETRVEGRFAEFQKMFSEVLGEVFGRERRKLRQETKKHVEEEVAKLRVGPRGERGERGAKGDIGSRGQEGRTGPKGPPGDSIVSWRIDRAKYTATPVLSDGSPGAPLELRGLFEQFVIDSR